jgi:hypothetical protein
MATKTATEAAAATETASAPARKPAGRPSAAEVKAAHAHLKPAPAPAPATDHEAEIARLKAELAAARDAAKSAKTAAKEKHEAGHRGYLTKPVEGKVADFARLVEREYPELGELSEREQRFVLITLRAYRVFQAEANGRTPADDE